VDFVYPTLTERTRTLRVRLSVANPDGTLKPGLYGTAAFESAGRHVIVYLDEAFDRYMAEGRIHAPEDVDAAVVEGASARVRPLVMTVATTVLGLLPLLWEAGVGADVSARTAAPVVGGLWSCMLLTLLVLPAAYAMWRRHQVRLGLKRDHIAINGRRGRLVTEEQRQGAVSCTLEFARR
jgi:Cu(I)/Ag(I) efflux system membrane protein CusA/SilA